MSSAESAPVPEREVAQALRLRAPARPVVRLSRRVLIALGGTAAVALAGAVLFALHVHLPKPAAQELYNTSHSNPAEGLGKLPKDYTGVRSGGTSSAVGAPTGFAAGASPADGAPQLGPPLPGDLGRPILNAQAGDGPDYRWRPDADADDGDCTTSRCRSRPSEARSGTRFRHHQLIVHRRR